MADLGHFHSMVDGIGAMMAAGLSIMTAIVGKSPFSPPVDVGKLYVRIIAMACAVLASAIWWYGQVAFDTDVLMEIAFGATIVALIAGLAYVAGYLLLCLKCQGDLARYLAGLRLKPQAKRVLAGDLNMPPPYGPLLTAPTDVQQYFCDGGKKASFIWTRGSVALAAVLMLALYAVLLMASAGALSASWMAIFKLDMTVTTKSETTSIELPADTLFAFDSADLRADALPELERTAAILKRRNIRNAVIEGHSDSRGAAAYNLRLSERRAAVVYAWLMREGGLGSVRFTVLGRGQSSPRAPNVHPNGSDDPDGRAKNRRVEIMFDAAS